MFLCHLTIYQVIFSGSGSNCTIEHIIDQSSLIEVYCSCHKVIQDNFLLTPVTLQHAAPQMERSMEQVMGRIQSSPKSSATTLQCGCNALQEGMEALLQKMSTDVPFIEEKEYVGTEEGDFDE